MDHLLVHLSVCLSVCPVDGGKTPERIRMPFGMVDRTGPGMRQVVGFGDRSMGRGNFRGKYGVPHCNLWGLFIIGNSHCAAARLLLVEFLELQVCRAGEACRIRCSNAVLLPRDCGQTCHCCSKFRAETDLERVQSDRKRLSSQLQQRERDLMQSQLHEKQLSRTNKILSGKLKIEKDEVASHHTL